MSHSNIRFRAIAPIYSPLNLRLGVDQFSTQFIAQLTELNSHSAVIEQKSWQGKFINFAGKPQNGAGSETDTSPDTESQYQSIDVNSKEVRLMSWQPNEQSNLIFHVYPNNIAVVEVEVELDINQLIGDVSCNDKTVKLLEDEVQLLAKQKIRAHFDDFCQDLRQLKPKLSNDYIVSNEPCIAGISWVSRTMLLTGQELAQERNSNVLKAWLAKTNRPQDAADIIAGTKNYSFTWLNYALKNAKPVGQDPYLDIMALCQYYYVSQENCNTALRSAIEGAYVSTTVGDKEKQSRKQPIEKMLARTRTACRLNKIVFYENIKYLTRPNRAFLKDILSGWEFDQLVENSERMIEVCDARLQEEDNKKRERSSIMTDYLLVALSFFAVFELSLYLTEFSREMMSRPALDYNDSKSSFFLSVIAEIDADIMFSFGFGLTLLLILVYRYLKRN